MQMRDIGEKFMAWPIRSVSIFTSIALLLLCGCAVVEVVPKEDLNGQRLTLGASPIAHIYVDNWGWYLFKYIPVLTGNLNKPGVPRLPLLFTDNVRVDRLVEKVSQESQRRGATIISDLRTRDRSYYMVWTLFFWLQEFEVSTNASVLTEAAEQPGQ